MKLDQRLHLLDQLDQAPHAGTSKRPVSAEAVELAQWATKELGRPVFAHQVQAVLDQPVATSSKALAAVQTATPSVPATVLPSRARVRTLMTAGALCVFGGMTIALTHALGPMSGLVYVAIGPVGGLMAGRGLRGWLDRRAAKKAPPLLTT